MKKGIDYTIHFISITNIFNTFFFTKVNILISSGIRAMRTADGNSSVLLWKLPDY
jgi:hypothetical protein